MAPGGCGAARAGFFTRMPLASRAPPPANTQNPGFGSGAGGRGAGAAGRPRWPGPIGLEAGGSGLRGGRRMADDEGSSEAIGSEADDDALGRRRGGEPARLGICG